MFPICIAAPNFKKQCFAPELLEKEKLSQNCEFFPENFKLLLVQTGFLLATMGVWISSGIWKPHWPLLNTQWPWAFVAALPRNAELCGTIVLSYLFHSPGSGSKAGWDPWSWWSSGWEGCLEWGFVECVEDSSTCRCQAGAAGSGCVGTLVGKEAQPCTQVKLSQQLLRAHTGVRTSVSSAFYKCSSLRLQNPPRRRILAEEQSWFV